VYFFSGGEVESAIESLKLVVARNEAEETQGKQSMTAGGYFKNSIEQRSSLSRGYWQSEMQCPNACSKRG
jgi:hypothetical protein